MHSFANQMAGNLLQKDYSTNHSASYITKILENDFNHLISLSLVFTNDASTSASNLRRRSNVLICPRFVLRKRHWWSTRYCACACVASENQALFSLIFTSTSNFCDFRDWKKFAKLNTHEKVPRKLVLYKYLFGIVF